MDRFDITNSQDTEEQEDEPFYYSQACAEEDIFWPGSDIEETAEETQQKHSRYEHQARRCLRGHLPMLQSAALRGPFSRWINPWRWVPEMKEDDWWQPGSENMLFTRANVMKRAADHGLGYLSPTEALAWCQASAQAEAQYINGGPSTECGTQSEVGNALVILDPEETTEQPLSKGLARTLNSKSTASYGQQSLADQHSDIPCPSEFAPDKIRGMKKAVDYKWLKSFYVPRRVQWDGPTTCTPTPFPERGEQPQRRYQNFPERIGSGKRSGPSRLSVDFADSYLERSQLDISASEPGLPSTAFTGGGHTSVKSARNGAYRGSSLKRDGDFLQRQREEIDELHDEPQRSSLASTSRSRSRRSSRRRSHGIADASSLDLEPNDLIFTTHRQQSSSKTPASGLFRQTCTPTSRSKQLPKLPRLLSNTPTTFNSLDVYNAGGGEEYSFVTEVAPSSRGLEMFQYRKKRRRKNSEASKTYPSGRGPVDNQEPPGTTLESEQNDEGEHQPHDLGLIRAESGTKIALPATGIEVPASKDTARQRGYRSDSIWNLVDDVTERPSSPLIEDGIAVETISPKHFDLAAHSSGAPISQTGEIASKMNSQHSKLSFRSSQSHQLQSLPDPGNTLPRPLAAKRRVGISQDPNDMRTGSHNTSLLRPAGLSGLENLQEANVDNIKCEATSSKEIQNVMGHIQRALSQQCPSVTSAASKQSDDEENEVGLGLIHERSLDRRHAPKSSGPNGSSQTSVKGGVMNGEHEADALPEFSIMNQPQLFRHTQCKADRDQFYSEDPEMEPEIEVIAETSTISFTVNQHSSYNTVKGQHSGPSPDSSGSTTDITRVGKSANGSLRENGGSADAESKIDRQFVRHELVSTKAVDITSETCWEGCGPQSPWVAENLDPLPMSQSETNLQGVLWNNLVSGKDGLCKGDDSPDKTGQSEQQDWPRLKRPHTPPNDSNTPFKDLLSLSPTCEATESYLKDDELLRTQLLVDPAANNPWSSNLRTPSLKNCRKRVSFKVLASEEKENSQPEFSDHLASSRRRPGSPPPPQDDTDDIFEGSTKNSHTFRKHFSAARQFKHIGPRNSCSPLNSSPAFGAQAEAFIAADRDTSAAKRQWTTSPRSASRQLVQTSPKAPATGLSNAMASFDMEDALDEVSDFLEDWSVDAELKKAKGSRSSSHREGNGFRRQMFRVV